MVNFYTDNDDIRFLFHHYDLAQLARVMEGDFSAAQQFDWAPANPEEALENYHHVLNIVGQISGEFIDPRAEEIDLQGNTLNDDGTVTRPPGMDENIRRLADAQLMGFTLPHRFGGLNFPNLLYTISNEIVSRADAALMNIYGLQGIAETINAFASEEVKQEYLPGFSNGKFTGAMVLTEPDAGSDLQAVKTAAHVYQDDEGKWFLHGVKRFITNGCGEVLLVLARSELDRTGGLGLSLFVCHRGPTIKVRRLENKLGIHGSPTCEMVFNHTPCQLVGERQRGLVTYVMSLMNGARVGIAAQSLGIAEAACRVARQYAADRKQFGSPIQAFPAVRDLLIDMKISIEVARALTYETCWWVDQLYGVERKIESGEITDKTEKRELKQQEKKFKRLAGMLTPMSKYYASEMCNRVAYDAIQVLGGSGYMKDYPVERHARDARITTIYEGTSQLQIIAAVRGVCSGAAEKYLLEFEQNNVADDLKDLLDILKQGRQQLLDAVACVKEKPGTEYMDLQGRKLVDAAIMIIAGHLFLKHASADPKHNGDFTQPPPNKKIPDDQTPDNNTPPTTPYRTVQLHKKIVARRYISANAAHIEMLTKEIQRGDNSSMTDFDLLVGPPASS